MISPKLKQDAKTSAATTIQAAYRGYSVRQGLNWKLPSGRTLRSTLREGLHPRAGFSGAVTSESSRYSTAWETMVPHEDRSGSLSDINTSFSEARSNARSATTSSRSLMVKMNFCLQYRKKKNCLLGIYLGVRLAPKGSLRLLSLRRS